MYIDNSKNNYLSNDKSGELSSDEFHARQRLPEKTYFSKSFKESYSEFSQKFAHKILDNNGNEFLLKDEKTL